MDRLGEDPPAQTKAGVADSASAPIHAGSCHCGRVRFEVETEIENVRECNCSICIRRGGLMVRVPQDALRLLTPPEALTVYRWGTGTAADYFCSTCGTLPFRQPSHPTAEERARGIEPFSGWSVNVRCLEGLDLDALSRIHIDGRSLVI